MRGSHVLTHLFTEESLQEMSEQKQRRGRSADLHARRNECIAARYYFYWTFREMRYEIAIKTLADDFFLSIYTLPEIITGHVSYIKSLKNDEVTPRDLAKMWPQFSWSI